MLALKADPFTPSQARRSAFFGGSPEPEAARLQPPETREETGFRAGALHDLRNMLSVIHSGASLLQSGRCDGRRDEVIEAIRSAALSAERIAAALGGKPRNEAQPIDVASALARLAALIRARLPDRIWLSVRIVSELPPLEADPARFDSAILNLALNAVDAMPDGGRLEIRARARRGRLVLLVADTGTGMSAEVCRQALNPFFTTKPGRGSGLGLHQTAAYAADHGGTLRVRSRPGHGSVFRLSLASRA